MPYGGRPAFRITQRPGAEDIAVRSAPRTVQTLEAPGRGEE